MTTVNGRRRAGARYWVIAAAATAWNAFACADFLVTLGRNPYHLEQMSPEAVNWLDSAPSWTMVPWSLAVWGAMAGALLLLVRSRHAVAAFAVSLVGMAVSQAWQVSAGMPASMTTPPMLAMAVLVWIIALALLWFARRQRRRGVLR